MFSPGSRALMSSTTLVRVDLSGAWSASCEPVDNGLNSDNGRQLVPRRQTEVTAGRAQATAGDERRNCYRITVGGRVVDRAETRRLEALIRAARWSAGARCLAEATRCYRRRRGG